MLLAILRCAVAEIMFGSYVDKAVLSSEYTNIASDFFSIIVCIIVLTH